MAIVANAGRLERLLTSQPELYEALENYGVGRYWTTEQFFDGDQGRLYNEALRSLLDSGYFDGVEPGGARAMRVKPSAVRRLLTEHSSNPTIGTLAKAAYAVGLEITVA